MKKLITSIILALVMSSVLFNNLQAQTTKLKSYFQEMDSVELDRFLYADTVSGALAYEFWVQQSDSGVNRTITKNVNYFTLNELDEDAMYGLRYKIRVRCMVGNDTTAWGDTVCVSTIEEQQYQYGVIIVRLSEGNEYIINSFDSSKNTTPLVQIPNFKSINNICHIYKIVQTYGTILNKLPDLSPIYSIYFDEKFSSDSLLYYFTNSEKCDYQERLPIIKWIETFPNDPMLTSNSSTCFNCSNCIQWAMQSNHLNAQAAWNLIDNDNVVTIAIVDDAIRLDHEDIQDNIYINSNELSDNVVTSILSYFDPIMYNGNGNGIVDAKEFIAYCNSLFPPNITTLIDVYNNMANLPTIFNNMDDDENGYKDDIFGWDVTTGTGLAQPALIPPWGSTNWAHGTSVASVAASVTNNSVGIASLSYNHAKIIPVKTAFNFDPSANTSNPIEGIKYAIAAGADIINMSWAIPQSSYFNDPLGLQYFHQLIESAHNNLGIVFIAGMGNDNGIDYNYPALFDEVVAVGATNELNEVAGFSTVGSHTDLLAPGDNILTCYSAGTDTYRCVNGTSESSPMVASLWALMLSINPYASFSDIYDCITSTALVYPYVSNYDPDLHGHGLIDPVAAINCFLDLEPVASFATDVDFICPGTPIHFYSNSSGGPASSWHWTCATPGVVFSDPYSNETDITFPEVGAFTVQIQVCNANNECSVYSEELIIENISLELLTHNPHVFCDGSAYAAFIQVNGNSSFSIEYTTPNDPIPEYINTSSTIFNIPISEDGTYVITNITDESGCSYSPNIPILGQSEYCECDSKFNNNWICGGLLYSFSAPNFLTEFSTNTLPFEEAVATVSNLQGELLFYTNSKNVYNGNGIEFNNLGLPNSNIKANDVLILPHPIDNDVYYLFVIQSDENFDVGSGNIYYYTIDYSGLDLLPSTLPATTGIPTFLPLPATNPELFTLSERMTWAPRFDEPGYWIIASSLDGDRYVIYKMDIYGQVSLHQDYSFSVSPATIENNGEITFNLKRGLIATAYSSDHRVRLYSFDVTSGTMTFKDEIVFTGSTTGDYSPYGVEISPSGNYLYISDWTKGIVRFEIDDVFNIVDESKLDFHYQEDFDAGELQLGTNDIIYVARNGQNILSAFLLPDEVDPVLMDNFVSTTNPYSDFNGDYGLPQLLPERYLDLEIVEIPSCNICENSAELIINGNNPPFSILWSNNQTSTLATNLCASVSYSVTVQNSLGCSSIENLEFEYQHLNITINSIHGQCSGSTNLGSIDFSINGGTAPFEVEIAQGSTTIWEQTLTENTSAFVDDLPAGEYSLSVIDDMECVHTIIFEIPEYMPPVLEITDIISSCDGLSNGSATVEVTDGDGTSFTYLWNNNELTATATALNGGNNYVTVTDNNGCSSSALALVNNYSIDAEFHYILECPNLDVINNYNTYFILDDIPEDWEEYEYYWELGNGTISADPLAIVDYEYDGYYCPILTVTRENCVSSYQHSFYVYPDACYCSSNNYDYWYIDVEEDDEWENKEIYILDNLTIESGATLTVKNCILHFGPRGRIIINEGATLRSITTTFTSFEASGCNNMWYGIEVYGHQNAPTNINGKVFFLEGNDAPSVVKNAHIGVLLGKRNSNFICNSNSELANPYHNAASCGEIFTTGDYGDNLIFDNNGTDIRFNPPVEPGIYSNPSELGGVIFQSTELLDDAYNITHPDPYGFNPDPNSPHPYINPRNPWAARANSLQRTSIGIWASGQKFNHVVQSSFYNIERGVEIFHAFMPFSHENIFNENRLSIYQNNFNSNPVFHPFIEGNNFNLTPGVNLSGEEGGSIFISGCNNAFVGHNTFGDAYNTEQNYNRFGIVTENSSGFRIVENTLDMYIIGIVCFNSGMGGGYIGNETSFDGNEFSACYLNLGAQNFNMHLNLRCNQMNNPEPMFYFGSNFNNYGEMGTQGMNEFSGSIYNINQRPAGNHFMQQGRRQIYSGFPYTYIYHDQSLGFDAWKVQPDHYNGDFTFLWEYVGSEYVVGANGSCSQLIPDGDGLVDGIYDIEMGLGGITGDYDNVVLHIQQENTSIIADSITYHVPDQGSLVDSLKQWSPLSDTIMYLLLTANNFSENELMDILYYNLPVGQYCSDVFLQKISTFNKTHSAEAMSLQSHNPMIVSPTGYLREINSMETMYNMYVSKYLNLIIEKDEYQKDTLISYKVCTNYFSELKISYLLDIGDLQNAMDWLAAYEPENIQDTLWLEIANLLYSDIETDSCRYNFSNSQRQRLLEIASDCENGRAAAYARGLLSMIWGYRFGPCMEMFPTMSMPSLGSIKKIEKEEPDFWMGNPFPNPSPEVVYLPYNCPDNINAYICIYDINGRLMEKIPAQKGLNYHRLTIASYATGMYQYVLFYGNGNSAGKRFIKSDK